MDSLNTWFDSPAVEDYIMENIGESTEEEIFDENENPNTPFAQAEGITVHGIVIVDQPLLSRYSYTPSTICTPCSAEEQEFQTPVPMNPVDLPATIPVEEDEMVIYPVHDTIRQIEDTAPKKRKANRGPVLPRKLAKKHMHADSIAAVRGVRCACKVDCAVTVSCEDVTKERKHYWSLNQQAQKQYLVNKLNLDASPNPEETDVKFNYTVQNKKVCSKFWKKAYPMSSRMFTNVRRRVQVRNIKVSRRTRFNSLDRFSQSIKDYLDNFAETYGEPQPNKTTIHFPSGVGKQDVYVLYIAFCFETGDKCPSLGQFYRVWREKRGQLLCPKWTTFSKCSICTDIRFHLEKACSPQIKGETCNPSCLIIMSLFSVQVSSRDESFPLILYCLRVSGWSEGHSPGTS
jgi:hypothetical protein